ncbi:hypothetical protein CIK58_15830 [Brevibacterium aurantiacum]|uniref:hypothetical protein n=1 Tax=Brevibacterium aurantiacum TaxID=273384 RepID=UPI000BB952EC|nr:hypothetical protein [Brevibacterium aurantiacum]PCC55941.1 hypothetical protein CIK58_15830 [Brevibacterium aurantiacum]
MTSYESILESVGALVSSVQDLKHEAERLATAARVAEDEPLFPEFVPKTPDARRTEGTLFVLGLASDLARASKLIEEQYIELAITSTTASNPQIQAKTGRAKPTLIRRRRQLGL